MPERDPQMPPSPIAPNESHGTLSQAQQASSVAESEQIILSAPLPGSSHTSGTESLPQGNPHQLVDKPVLQETTDTYNSNLPPSSEAKFSPKLLDRKPMTEPNGQEVEYVASGSSSQSLDSESSDRRRDVETANVEDSITQYENPLQKELDDEIHLQAAEVIQEVSGGRRNVKTDNQRPFDPNLVCPMCRRQFRIGEIQKFKKHVNTCTGTDD